MYLYSKNIKDQRLKQNNTLNLCVHFFEFLTVILVHILMNHTYNHTAIHHFHPHTSQTGCNTDHQIPRTIQNHNLLLGDGTKHHNNITNH
jgi:hypothetical protein